MHRYALENDATALSPAFDVAFILSYGRLTKDFGTGCMQGSIGHCATRPVQGLNPQQPKGEVTCM